MKKLLLLLLAAVLLCTACACGETEEPEVTYVYVLKADASAADISAAASKVMATEMKFKIDDEKLSSLFHIAKADVEDYAGIYSLSFSCADNFIIVKPLAEKSADVKFALEQRRQDIIDLFTGSIASESEKAKASVVLLRGDYLVYICDDDVVGVTAVVDDFFDLVPETELEGGEETE